MKITIRRRLRRGARPMYHLECNKRVQEIDLKGIHPRDRDLSLRVVLPTTKMLLILEISMTKVLIIFYIRKSHSTKLEMKKY